MRPIYDLRRDEEGTFLVFFALALAVLLGMVALSFDLGRVASTQSELQSFSDSVALASAAELDGAPTAIARARQAARELITDQQTFGEGGQLLDLDDFTLTFLSALPANDSAPDPAANIVCSGSACASATTAQAARATLVRVDVNPHALPMAFASALSVLTGGEEREAAVAATATAGLTQFACDITPLMFCMPPGGLANGQMVNMVAGNGGGGAGPWGPGNFGFLDISNSYDPDGTCARFTGANRDRCLLGAVDTITQCYSMRGVNTEPGARIGLTTDPFNFRFDMWPNSTRNGANPMSESEDFAPAPNTIRGFVPTVRGANIDWCTPDTRATPTTIPYPRDESLSANLRFGTDRTFSGSERTRYVAANYGGVDPHPTATTRWAYYRAEIDAAGGPGSRTRILSNVPANRETGRAQCSPVQSTSYERRVVVAAGVNCNPASGGTEIRGNTPNVPVEEFYRVFLTEPVGTTGGTLSIYGEVIDSAGGAGSGGTVEGGIFRDVVQLYR